MRKKNPFKSLLHKESFLIACAYAFFLLPLAIGLSVLGVAWLAPNLMDAFLAGWVEWFLTIFIYSGVFLVLGYLMSGISGSIPGETFFCLGLVGFAVSFAYAVLALTGPWVFGWGLTIFGMFPLAAILTVLLKGCNGCQFRDECDEKTECKNRKKYLSKSCEQAE